MNSIGIIIPSWHYFADPFKLQPIYELYFATILTEKFKNDIAINVIDLREARKSDNFSKYIRGIGQNDIYFYWIMKTADYPEITNIVEKLRLKYPDSKHVAGGTHVENFVDESKKVFDSIISGPGDKSIIDIVLDHETGSLKEIYKDKWENRPYCDSPYPKRHFLPESAIVNTELFKEYGGIKGTSVMFQRGCCFDCAYCVYNVPRFIQTRRSEQIKEEISYLKEKYDVKGINLRDEIAIPLNEKISREYLDAIKQCDVIWRGQTKVGVSKNNMVSRDTVKLAAESGCVELSIGVETVSQEVLDIIDKRQDIRQVREYIKNCHDFGIKIKICLILGLPGEPENIVKMTKNFIAETEPDFVNVSGFCPVPGSKIYEDQKYYGIKRIDTDWNKHAHLMLRFSDEEDFGIPFEYEKSNRWGKTFSRSEIIQNIKEIQHFCQNRQMVY